MKTSTRITMILIVLCVGAFAGWMYVKLSHTDREIAVVDINTADVAELDALPYITPAAAQGIVDGRPFIRVDDLTRVSGIGEKTLERIRPYVKVQ